MAEKRIGISIMLLKGVYVNEKTRRETLVLPEVTTATDTDRKVTTVTEMVSPGMVLRTMYLSC